MDFKSEVVVFFSFSLKMTHRTSLLSSSNSNTCWYFVTFLCKVGKDEALYYASDNVFKLLDANTGKLGIIPTTLPSLLPGTLLRKIIWIITQIFLAYFSHIKSLITSQSHFEKDNQGVQNNSNKKMNKYCWVMKKWRFWVESGNFLPNETMYF